MTNKELTNIVEQLPDNCKQNINYKLYQQAAAASSAVEAAAFDSWKSAADDKLLIVIDGKQFAVNIGSADVLGYVNELLAAIKEFAVNELQLLAE